MLTLDEVQSTQQTAYEQQLEELSEAALRDLLEHDAKLKSLAPPHLSHAESRGMAEAALAHKTTPQTEALAPAATPSAMGRLLARFWTPFR